MVEKDKMSATLKDQTELGEIQPQRLISNVAQWLQLNRAKEEIPAPEDRARMGQTTLSRQTTASPCGDRSTARR